MARQGEKKKKKKKKKKKRERQGLSVGFPQKKKKKKKKEILLLRVLLLLLLVLVPVPVPVLVLVLLGGVVLLAHPSPIIPPPLPPSPNWVKVEEERERMTCSNGRRILIPVLALPATLTLLRRLLKTAGGPCGGSPGGHFVQFE